MVTPSSNKTRLPCVPCNPKFYKRRKNVYKKVFTVQKQHP